MGPRSYSCIIVHNNREIKRHLNQIRDNKALQENSDNNNGDIETPESEGDPHTSSDPPGDSADGSTHARDENVTRT